jgi:hypothetical protein
MASYSAGERITSRESHEGSGTLKTPGTGLRTVFGLALLFALLAVAYFLLKYVVGVFAGLGADVGTIAAIASVVAILCAAILAEGLKARGRTDQPAVTVAEKAAVYERLLSLCCGRLARQGSSDGPAPDAELAKLERLLALHGSTKVISAYVRLRLLAKEEGRAVDAGEALLKTLAMEMRSDLGRGDSLRKPDELLELLLDRS